LVKNPQKSKKIIGLTKKEIAARYGMSDVMLNRHENNDHPLPEPDMQIGTHAHGWSPAKYPELDAWNESIPKGAVGRPRKKPRDTQAKEE
jgi:hypothetical protein